MAEIKGMGQCCLCSEPIDPGAPIGPPPPPRVGVAHKGCADKAFRDGPPAGSVGEQFSGASPATPVRLATGFAWENGATVSRTSEVTTVEEDARRATPPSDHDALATALAMMAVAPDYGSAFEAARKAVAALEHHFKRES